MLDVPAPRGTRRERSFAGAARLLAAVLAFVGLVGLLRVGGGDFSSAGTEDLVGLTVHPLTALVWFVMGLVGVALSVDPGRSRLYLIGAGGLLVLWSLVSVVTGGPSAFFTTDSVNLAFQLVLGVGALAVALGPTPVVVEKALAVPDPDVETDS